MKKQFTTVLVSLLLLSGVFVSSTAIAKIVPPDEGMWVPMFLEKLNIKDMRAMGCKLTAEDIYSVNQSSIKDAIIIFGGGCTGEIVSPEGLIFTNHHCGYGSIQKVSTVENDYLTNGFWAKNHEEEIPIEGLSVKFLVKMEDVTNRILEGVTDEMTEMERSDIMNMNADAIEKEATDGNHYRATVETYFGGNEFYLVIYEVFTDIRLAGTPPEAIGKYGADTDNWMWPRHTGDFSIFRVYTSPDGSPAKFDVENVPYKSKHYLPISIKDRKPGDFVFIMGYPGSTERYLTSYGVDQNIDLTSPAVVKIRTEKLDVMREFMDADPTVRLQYASKFAQTANYWKYFQGQMKALKKLKVADDKRALEADFQAWADADSLRQEKYGNVMNLYQEAYTLSNETALFNTYFIEAFFTGNELTRYARNFSRLGRLLAADTVNQEAVDNSIAKLRKGITSHFKDYYKPLDQKSFAATMGLYYWDVPQDQQPNYLIEKAKEYRGDFDKWASDVYLNTNFADAAKVEALLDNPTAEAIMNDPAIQIWNGFINYYMQAQEELEAQYEILSKAERLFIAGLREMNPDMTYYPDANFTLRVTYGTVGGYSPEDACEFSYYTTTDGILQKEDPSNPEFVVPCKLKELIENKDFGPYANKKGEMPVGFLSDNDITGGNSGSPVMDARGNLIGLAFDGNWEAMSGDINFDAELQRTINVDIRYVLFIIDKLGGAQNIIDELEIVK